MLFISGQIAWFRQMCGARLAGPSPTRHRAHLRPTDHRNRNWWSRYLNLFHCRQRESHSHHHESLLGRLVENSLGQQVNCHWSKQPRKRLVLSHPREGLGRYRHRQKEPEEHESQAARPSELKQDADNPSSPARKITLPISNRETALAPSPLLFRACHFSQSLLRAFP